MSTTKYVVLFSQTSEPDRSLVGAKAANLIICNTHKFLVPNGFCITTIAFESFLAQTKLTEFVKYVFEDLRDRDNLLKNLIELRKRIKGANIPESIADEILRQFRSLALSKVAVRSSAVYEDQEDMSFAGMYDSILNVTTENDLLNSILDVWASHWSDRVVEYRISKGISNSSVDMGVIVQEMLLPQKAGVLFTVDPLTGDTRYLVVNSAAGLGHATVSGEIDPNRYTVDKETKSIIQGNLEHRLFNIQDIGPKGRLTRKELDQLTDAGKRLENLFGNPQDIEWAFQENTLYLLQARPVAGLGWLSLDPIQWMIPIKNAMWGRTSIAEFIPDPITPFYAAFQIPMFSESYRELRATIGINSMFPEPPLVVINDYVYVRMDLKPNLRSVISLLRKIPVVIRDVNYLWYNEILQKHIIFSRHASNEVNAKNLPRLLNTLHDICRQNASYWKSIALATWVWKYSERLFAFFHNILLRKRLDIQYSQLLQGLPTAPQKAQQSLMELADMFRDNVELQEILIEHGFNKAKLLRVNGGSAFLASLERFIDGYGFQVPALDFVYPTIGENPNEICQILIQSWRSDKVDSAYSTAIRERLGAEQAIKEISPFPLQSVYTRMLRWAQQMAILREDMAFFLPLNWPTARRILKRVGKLLENRGIIEHEADVAYLTREELTEVANSDGRFNFKESINQRKKRRDNLRTLTPPYSIPDFSEAKIGQKLVYLLYGVRDFDFDNSVIVGIPASRGRVTGIAQIVRSIEDMSSFIPGRILVVPTVNPVWTPIFSLATGIVTDVGGVLSHGSIIAREFGIPAVLGAKIATRKIRNGQQITVDGNRGRVYL